MKPKPTPFAKPNNVQFKQGCHLVLSSQKPGFGCKQIPLPFELCDRPTAIHNQNGHHCRGRVRGKRTGRAFGKLVLTSNVHRSRGNEDGNQLYELYGSRGLKQLESSLNWAFITKKERTVPWFRVNWGTHI